MFKNKPIEAKTDAVEFSVGKDSYSVRRCEDNVKINQKGGDTIWINYHGWVALTDAIQKIGVEIARENIK